jgi:hypothetical protein
MAMAMEMNTLGADRPEPKVEEEEVYEYKPFNWRNVFLKPKYIRG